MLADVLEQRLTILQAVMGVALLGGLGIFMLLVLGLARRRYLHHQRLPKPSGPMPDIWQESGRRLVQRQDQAGESPSASSTPQEPPLRRPNFLEDLDHPPPPPDFPPDFPPESPPSRRG